MSFYLSLLSGLLWCLPGTYLFYLLVLWVVTALCAWCLGRLFRCRAAIVPQVGSIQALEQGEVTAEITVWTSEEGQVMCLKWQAGVVLLLPDLTELD